MSATSVRDDERNVTVLTDGEFQIQALRFHGGPVGRESFTIVQGDTLVMVSRKAVESLLGSGDVPGDECDTVQVERDGNKYTLVQFEQSVDLTGDMLVAMLAMSEFSDFAHD